MQEVATLAELDLEAVLGLPVAAPVAAEIAAHDARLDRLERPWPGWRPYGWSVGTGSRLVSSLSQHPWGALGRVLCHRAEWPARSDAEVRAGLVARPPAQLRTSAPDTPSAEVRNCAPAADPRSRPAPLLGTGCWSSP